MISISKQFNSIKLLAAGVLLTGLGFTLPAQAQTETFTINMNHKQFQGQNRVVRLKQELNRAYPGWDFSDARLSQVRLFAKSRRGNGQAELQIANIPADRAAIPEANGSFSGTGSRTYNEIRLDASGRTRGSWELVLDGNNKVQKIELRIRDAEGPSEPDEDDEPTTRWVNVGTGSTIKIVPTTQNFRINEEGVRAIEIEARGNLLVLTKVVVQYGNGVYEEFPSFEGELFQGQSKRVSIQNREVTRIWVTGLTAIPFGADATYRIRAQVRN